MSICPFTIRPNPIQSQVQFISGYHMSGGTRFPVTQLRSVSSNYLKTWFSIDLVAAIPFDRFFSSSGGSVLIRLPGLIKTVPPSTTTATTATTTSTAAIYIPICILISSRFDYSSSVASWQTGTI